MTKERIKDFEQSLRLLRSFEELLEYTSNTLNGFERVHIQYIGIQLGLVTDRLESLVNREKEVCDETADD